jgi:hypothetical protein
MKTRTLKTLLLISVLLTLAVTLLSSQAQVSADGTAQINNAYVTSDNNFRAVIDGVHQRYRLYVCRPGACFGDSPHYQYYQIYGSGTWPKDLWVITNVNPNTVYCVEIKSDNGAVRHDVIAYRTGSGSKPYSGSIISRVNCPWKDGNIPPNTPNLISPSNNSSIDNPSIELKLQDKGDPDNYPRDYRNFRYYIEKSDGTWSQESNWIGNTSWTVTLPSAGNYRWRAKSGDGESSSAWTGWWALSYTTTPSPSPALTRSRLYVDDRNYLVLEFCGKNIDQNVYIGSKRQGRDFGIHTKHVNFGSSEQCATDSDLADGEVLPERTYYSGVALSQSDVYDVCSSSRGLCDSVKTSPAQPVPPPQPPPGGSCPVPFFWQQDPRWKNHPLRTGGYGTCSPTCRIIGNCGCTLTSATMIFDYYGANTTRNGKTMNPPNLSDCMGKYACPFTWGTGNWCASNKVSQRSVSFSWSVLEHELSNGRPVMLRLTRPGGAHYVVAVSGSGRSAQGYLVNDPALKQGKRVRLSAVLARRNYTPKGMHLYAGTPDCQMINDNGMSGLDQTVYDLSSTQPVTGSIVPYRNTELTMTLELEAQSLEGDVEELLIWTDSISNTIWQPFTEYVALPLSEEYFVQFRDDADSVSDVITAYSDPLASPPELRVIFLPLILR